MGLKIERRSISPLKFGAVAAGVAVVGGGWGAWHNPMEEFDKGLRDICRDREGGISVTKRIADGWTAEDYRFWMTEKPTAFWRYFLEEIIPSDDL
ncbi:unnamed protein product [Cylicocyclus nassatus]|uniref:Uncharacterized protein n=1 Tax=Cylicocyclus nassatus TaxID=53992 RepID=A0AA36DNA4_CYLNA|nr:unnamed protein product [Cylicocyclus nassatus]